MATVSFVSADARQTLCGCDQGELAALEERSRAAHARLEDKSAELEDVLQARPAPAGSISLPDTK